MTQSSSTQIFLSNAPPGGSQSLGAFSSGQAGYQPAFLSWLDDAGEGHQFVCFVKTEDYDFGADITEHPVEMGSNITDNVRVKLREAKIFFFETNTPIDSNNWANAGASTSIITVPGAPAAPPQQPTEYNAWNNLITERALAATATGAIGNLIGGAVGGAVGTLVGEIGGDLIVGGGVPVPQVWPPPPPSLTALAPPQNFQSSAMGFTNLSGVGGDFVAATIGLLEQLLNTSQVMVLNGPKNTISNVVIESVHIHRDAEVGDGAEIEVGLKEIRFVTTTTVPSPAPAVIRASTPVNKGELGVSDLPDGQQVSVATAIAQYAGLIR